MKTIPATADVVADRSLVGTALAEAYTAEVDGWLGLVIDEVGDLPGFALAAVGGYGRGDLSPGSDLDLLLVCQFEGSACRCRRTHLVPDLGFGYEARSCRAYG